jgi:serine/threonine-protein kinase RsbW
VSVHTLVLQNERAEVPRAAVWLGRIAEDLGVPVSIARRLDLCLEEAVLNVIDHAYDDRRAHEIVLRLERRGDELLLTVEDDGRAFNPLEVPPSQPARSLEEAPVGGWGLPLIRRFADGRRYERVAGRNRLTLSVRQPRV